MDFLPHQAIYLQIADYICERIMRKEWLAQNKIPSIRDLAVALEVNPNTVVRAYNYLEEQNIIYKERGIGYFTAVNGYENAIALKKTIFIKEFLPIIFKNLELLQLSFSDFKKMYDTYSGTSHESQ
jgi:GntR family transcriptional regulator